MIFDFRARYYDPRSGRFLSEDPIGFKSGDLNFYSYASINPLLYTDPTGNFRVGQFLAGSALAIAGGGLVAISVVNPGYAALTKFVGITVGVSIGVTGLALIVGSFTAEAAPVKVPYAPTKINCGEH